MKVSYGLLATTFAVSLLGVPFSPGHRNPGREEKTRIGLQNSARS